MAGPRANVASGAFSAGTNSAWMPSCFAAKAMGSTPLTLRTVPSKPNSPKKALVCRGLRMLPAAHRTLKRIGRS